VMLEASGMCYGARNECGGPLHSGVGNGCCR